MELIISNLKVAPVKKYMKIDESTFIDTNLLVFTCDYGSPWFKQAVALREDILKGNINACISPQVLYEFYAVITNPKRVLNPISVSLALKEVRNYIMAKQFKKIYPSSETTLNKVFELVETTKLDKTDIFDAHIIAVMLESGIYHILTDNEKDFMRFKGIKVTNPFKVK